MSPKDKHIRRIARRVRRKAQARMEAALDEAQTQQRALFERTLAILRGEPDPMTIDHNKGTLQ